MYERHSQGLTMIIYADTYKLNIMCCFVQAEISESL